MRLKFGTSGLRGLVSDMTDRECFLYTIAFLRYLKTQVTPTAVSLGGDLRTSTPGILRAVARAIEHEGLELDFCGAVPTPALLYHGISLNQASIMVTGSHIPEDRNGIKFSLPWGEVLKPDEAFILGFVRGIEDGPTDRGPTDRGPTDRGPTDRGPTDPLFPTSLFDKEGNFKTHLVADLRANPGCLERYRERYLNAFPPQCLRGHHVVVYEHSSVSRDLISEILEALGASVSRVGRSDDFVALDTEALDNQALLAGWVRKHQATALVSADADGDRPLVVDDLGRVVRGDVLGILVAQCLGAEAVVTPVSSNTALERSNRFKKILRTRIGSPYVISEMTRAVREGFAPVVGYEANGGFLTATAIDANCEASQPRTHSSVESVEAGIEPARQTGHASENERGRLLSTLPTRDALLPIIAALFFARRKEVPLSGLVDALPPRFTASGRLRDVSSEAGRALIEKLEQEHPFCAEKSFGAIFGSLEAADFTDGARLSFAGGDIIHLRPSGNAPEFRCYSEAAVEARAEENVGTVLRKVKEVLLPGLGVGIALP